MEKRQIINEEGSANSSKNVSNSSSGAVKKKNVSKNKKVTTEKKKTNAKEKLSQKINDLGNEHKDKMKTSTVSPKYVRTYSEELRARKKLETQNLSFDEASWPSLSSTEQKIKQSNRTKQSIDESCESTDQVSTPRPKRPFMDRPDPKNNYPKSLPSTPVCRKSLDKQLNRKAKTPQKKFEPYIPLFEVQQGLKRGEFIEGALRINPRSYEDAYVSAPDGQMDIYIGGIRDRNRALNGDSVVVQVNPKQEWKVLCDAIKDYEEKHGQSIVEAVYSPISSPCKIHTPDKFSRVQSRASSAWNDTAFGERRPDSLEILGIDKLAQQLGTISVQSKKKNRSKRQRMKKNKNTSLSDESKIDSGSQKSSTTSYSHGSSEDYLNKISSEESPDDKPLPALLPINGSMDNEDLIKDKIIHDIINNQSCEIPKLDETKNESNENSDNSHNLTGKSESWDTKNSSVSLIVSPHQLLDFAEGNELQDYCDHHLKNKKSNLNDSSSNSSPVRGIIVAPHDLTGDEFTDSASTASSDTGQLEQIIEDSKFVIDSQDISNNNINDNQHIETLFSDGNNGNIMDTIITAPQMMPVKEITEITSCKIEESLSQPVISSVAVVADSTCGSEILIDTSVDHQEFSSIDFKSFTPAPVQNSVILTTTNISSSNNKTSSKKKKKKKNRFKTNTVQNLEIQTADNNLNLIKSYSVEDIMKHPLWAKFIQKTGKVIYISEKVHSRVAAGYLKLLNDKNPNFALFSARDHRFPRLLIPMSECPKQFYNRPHDFSNYLFLAKFDNWREDDTFAQGTLIKNVGKTGNIDTETECILQEFDVDDNAFSPDIIDCLPKTVDFIIPQPEMQKRKDFRSQCVFTIDPATARDMDDAVSCELMKNGNYLIGVHIADVTYFIEENNALDKIAESRATSVYLVQKVVPMLPRILCDNLCSLKPGQDRLTFSVLWEMTPDANIVNQMFERSIIKSCVKMSYEHAQDMIENIQKTYDSDALPEIYGNFNINDISLRVRKLHELALLLRKKRFEDGALRLDQTKLQFTLNHETGLPVGFSAYEQKDSHRLIEEFMLLSNMAVARKIYEIYPQLAVLRCHPPPQEKAMNDIVSMCESVGIHLDATNSGTLQTSILRYAGEDEISQSRSLILANLCSKPMQRAKYFCSGIHKNVSSFHHYALNVPFYTHFTSPIRRYPDILVHRLLGAALGYNSLKTFKPESLEKCTIHCNVKKYNAKIVSEMSDELFLGAFIQHCGTVAAQAMVINVMDHSFDCLILNFGVIKRVYCDKLPLIKKSFQKINGIPTLNLVWKVPESSEGLHQKIMLLSSVDVDLTTGPGENLQIAASLKCPNFQDN